MPCICTSSTSSRPRLNLSGMYGTAGRVMKVGRAPLKRRERVPGPPNLSPALPAIPVLHPGLEHLRPPPCRGPSRGAMGALQILAQCPGLPLTSLGCPLEGGLKMGRQHQGTQSPCLRRAQRMSFPLRCTRCRQGSQGSLCPRMEVTVALPSHLPAMEGSSECRLAPRVWCLCVRAWPREVPTLGLPQPQERNWGSKNQGTQDSSLIPRTPLGSECGARNWSPAQPQYCHLRTLP